MNQVRRESQAIAEATAESMYARDNASRALGMRIEEVRPGQAKLSMRVREDMVNGHGIIHGGMIFSLADSAFAFACNTYNQATVALAASIQFLAAGRLGDVLTAEAWEQALGGKTGVYDVVVTNQEGQRIALFRGNSYRVKGNVIPEENHD